MAEHPVGEWWETGVNSGGNWGEWWEPVVKRSRDCYTHPHSSQLCSQRRSGLSDMCPFPLSGGGSEKEEKCRSENIPTPSMTKAAW